MILDEPGTWRMHKGRQVRTFMDGNAWCAVRRDFDNIQDSHVGFGETEDESIADLERDEGNS